MLIRPNPLLFLEMAQEAETIKKQHRGCHRGSDPELLEPFAFGSLHANHQRSGQSPKQRGETAHQAPQRTKQFGIRGEVRHGLDRGGRRLEDGAGD